MSEMTAEGCQNAPIAFFDFRPLTPVLPPMLESTIASSVVGIATSRTPRCQTAAANPARSPTVPPPTAITIPPRSICCRSRNPSTFCSCSIDFERSLAGMAWMAVFNPARLIALATFTAYGRAFVSVTIAAPVGSRRVMTLRSSRPRLVPIRTG